MWCETTTCCMEVMLCGNKGQILYYIMNIKSTIAIILCLSAINFGWAQSAAQGSNIDRGYSITHNLNDVDIAVFHKHLENCNFDVYRQYSARRIINFSNGITISLDSAEEIISNGRFIKISEITPDDQPTEFPKTFEINSQGYVMLKYDNTDLRTIKANQQLKEK